MPSVHREDDLRVNGAATISVGQSTVRINSKLVAVVGDPDDATGGEFLENGSTVKIGGISVIVVGDSALPDGISAATDAATGSGTVNIG